MHFSSNALVATTQCRHNYLSVHPVGTAWTTTKSIGESSISPWNFNENSSNRWIIVVIIPIIVVVIPIIVVLWWLYIYIYMVIMPNFKIFQLSNWHFDAFWGLDPPWNKQPGGRPSSAARWSVAPRPRAERLTEVSNSGDQSWIINMSHGY